MLPARLVPRPKFESIASELQLNLTLPRTGPGKPSGRQSLSNGLGDTIHSHSVLAK